MVICADGTWNLRDQLDEETGKRKPTNVTKVARAVLPRARDGTDQVVFYHDGIGTSGPLDKVTGGAFGRGIEDNVRNLYRFIVYNYSPADELYFFGFSRGAFTVRTLAGFMHFVGLVEKDDDYFVPDLWDCYENSKGPDTPEWARAHRKIQNKRPCPPIKFIGAWDTVGALGAPGVLGQVLNPGKYRYHDVDLHDAIENACHALAIDEQRKPFAPTLWTRPPGWKGRLDQAWFPGVHSNVGGGCTPDGLANEPLHWVVEKAAALGLEFDDAYLGFFKPCFNSTLHDSMSLKYRVFGPHVRPIGRFPQDETLHQAAIDRRNLFDDYRPTNLEAFVSNGSTQPLAQTTRIPRGKPC
jgi:uncharacterized protein (DUF2235 family)